MKWIRCDSFIAALTSPSLLDLDNDIFEMKSRETSRRIVGYKIGRQSSIQREY